MSDCVQNGETPIFAAAASDHKKCIETLAGLGGDVNKANTVSVCVRLCGAAQAFVEAHGDVCNMLGWPALGTAVGMGGPWQKGESPTYFAAYAGNKECIETLASLGGDMNAAANVREKAWCVHADAGARSMLMGRRMGHLWLCVERGDTDVHCSLQRTHGMH